MSRNVKYLGGDLKSWMERSAEEAKEKIAYDSAQDAYENAPKESGFLGSEIKVFVNNKLLHQVPYKPTHSKNRVSLAPNKNYGNGVTLVSRAGRAGANFDYAYYLGVINPNHLNNVDNQKWLDTALHPESENVISNIKLALDEKWPTLKARSG